MHDRVALIVALDDVAKLKAADLYKVTVLYDKALAALLPSLTLADAKRLLDEGAQVGTLVQNTDMPPLKKVAKLWDPKLKIAKEATLTWLRDSLCDLLEGRRELTSLPPKVPTAARNRT
jgi:hypothetical protein